jgi:predicted CoA-binding protein
VVRRIALDNPQPLAILKGKIRLWMAAIRTIEDILRDCKTVAVVGLSPNPARPSHRVAVYLQEQGYRVVPVNPNAAEILGERCYPNLTAIPYSVELVDIFRRSEEGPPVIDEAIQVGAKAVWMQLGIVNEAAAKLAQEAGLDVVMDKCTAIEHRALAQTGKL